MAGVGLGLLREAAERGFRSAGQVRRELGVPCLALLPHGRAAAADAHRRAAEALGAVKLAIDQATGGSRPRRIGFAPVSAGDGATARARSFAALLAAGGAATLLLDADMRDEGLSRELALSGDPGFADTLGGRSVAPTRRSPRPACASSPPAPIDTPRRPPSPSARRRSAKRSPAPPRPSTSWWSISPRSPASSTPAPWSATSTPSSSSPAGAAPSAASSAPLLAADRDLRRKLVGVILNRAAPGERRPLRRRPRLDGLA